MDWGVVISLLAAEGLYLRALRVLRRRGVAVPRGQVALWHLGIALWVVAFASPVHLWAEHLLCAHMAEHLLIADLGAPLLLAGARWPVLLFLIPKEGLKALARMRRLRRAFRTLRRPLVALPVYVVVLYAWHLSFAFEAAVRHPLVHVLQHASFVAIGLLVWWPGIDPQHRRARGELWKVPYMIAARFAGMFLGMGFVAARVPVYAGVYGRGIREGGIGAIADQQIAGGFMFIVDVSLMVFALVYFFVRAARDADAAAAREAGDAGRAAAAT